MTAPDQLWVLGDLYTFHLSSPEIAIIEIESDFHHGPPPHSHDQEVETLYVVEGELDVVRGSETLAAGKGSFVHFPKGVVHTFKTRSPEGSRILVTIQPGNLANLFREIGTRDPSLSADAVGMGQAQEKLIRLAEEYGLQVFPAHAS